MEKKILITYEKSGRALMHKTLWNTWFWSANRIIHWSDIS